MKRTSAIAGRVALWSLLLGVLSSATGCMATNGWVFNNSGMGYYQKGNFAAARHEFATAVNYAPWNPDYRHNLAMAMKRTGDIQAAERVLQHNLSIDAMHQPTYHALAQIMVDQGRQHQAMDLVQTWQATQPYVTGSHIEMAWLQREVGNLPAAEQSLRTALRMEPQNPAALAQLGQVYQEAGRPQQAAEMYQRSLAVNYDQPQVQSRLAAVSVHPQPAMLPAQMALRHAQPMMAASTPTLSAPGMIMAQPMTVPTMMAAAPSTTPPGMVVPTSASPVTMAPSATVPAGQSIATTVPAAVPSTVPAMSVPPTLTSTVPASAISIPPSAPVTFGPAVTTAATAQPTVSAAAPTLPPLTAAPVSAPATAPQAPRVFAGSYSLSNAQPLPVRMGQSAAAPVTVGPVLPAPQPAPLAPSVPMRPQPVVGSGNAPAVAAAGRIAHAPPAALPSANLPAAPTFSKGTVVADVRPKTQRQTVTTARPVIPTATTWTPTSAAAPANGRSLRPLQGPAMPATPTGLPSSGWQPTAALSTPPSEPAHIQFEHTAQALMASLPVVEAH